MAKATIDRAVLVESIGTVVGATERTTTLPILGNVLLTKEGGVARLTASDTVVQITRSTQSMVSAQEFSITIPAKKFADIAKSLNCDDITLDVRDGDMLMKGGKSRFTLKTLPAYDYPLLVTEAPDISITLPQSDLRKAIRLIEHAMAINDVRPYLNGSLMSLKDGAFTMSATDGHRLSHAVIATEGMPDGAMQTILPRKTVLLLGKLLEDSDAPVTIHKGGLTVTFNFDSTELISKTVEGSYPEVLRVIPQNHPNSITFDRNQMLVALRRIMIVSTGDTDCGVSIALNGDSVKLERVSSSTQEEAVEEIEVQYSGERFTIGFNGNYLIDMLEASPAENIDWSFAGGEDAPRLALLGRNSASANWLNVVMPVRL